MNYKVYVLNEERKQVISNIATKRGINNHVFGDGIEFELVGDMNIISLYQDVMIAADVYLEDANTKEEITNANRYNSNKLGHYELVSCYGLDFLLGNASKYIFRHTFKGGKKDLQKAIVYIKQFQKECQMVDAEYYDRYKEDVPEIIRPKRDDLDKLSDEEFQIITDLIILCNCESAVVNMLAPSVIDDIDALIKKTYGG